MRGQSHGFTNLPMKLLLLLRFLLLAAVAACGLSSCVGVDGYPAAYYDDDGYAGGYDYAPRTYYHSPSYYSAGYGYSRYRYNRDCDDNHSHSSSRSNDDDRKIKLVGGNDGRHGSRPEGWHSVEWFKDRGYNLNKYSHKHEDGDVHKGTSAHRSSKHDDDDNKHHSSGSHKKH